MASTGGNRGDQRDAQRAQALLGYLLETVTIFDSDGTVVYTTGDERGCWAMGRVPPGGVTASITSIPRIATG